MGLHYVFHPSCSRHISPDRAEGRVSDMQWKGEVFYRLVGYAQKTYKIGINAASIPVCGSLARESSEYHVRAFSLSGACLAPLHRDPMPCTNAITVEASCSNITFVHSKNAPDLGRFFGLDKHRLP